MCVHHQVLGSALGHVTVDIELVDGGFEILLVAMISDVPDPGESFLNQLNEHYMSDRFTFKDAGLKAVKFVPYQEGRYSSIYNYTFSPYGLCELMMLRAVDMELEAGRMTLNNGKFPGSVLSSPIVNGRPDVSKAVVTTPSPRIQGFMDEIAARHASA